MPPSRAALDNYFVPGMGELAHPLGNEPNTVFLNLDLSWHTDSHRTLPVKYF